MDDGWNMDDRCVDLNSTSCDSAWSRPADAVFLDEEEERAECVLNESGVIYHGSWDDISERDWNYGQVSWKPRQPAGAQR